MSRCSMGARRACLASPILQRPFSPLRKLVVVRATQPDAIVVDIPVVNLEELDGSSADAFYGHLAERGQETLNVIVCYTVRDSFFHRFAESFVD